MPLNKQNSCKHISSKLEEVPVKVLVNGKMCEFMIMSLTCNDCGKELACKTVEDYNQEIFLDILTMYKNIRKEH